MFAVFSLVAVLPVPAAGAEAFSTPEHPQELLDADRAAAWGTVPIFFPPEPPPLGSIGANGTIGPWPISRLLRAPPELAAYLGEPFYPALGTLLALHDLSRWSRRRVEEYRTAKLKLQAELRQELLRLRDVPADARRERLVAFAREQTPKIAALEQTAERLRESFTKIDYRWGELRSEYLGYNSHNPESADTVAGVMRAAAYYEGGLLPAQRRFLREIAIEIPLAGETVAEAIVAQPYVFFSPGLARVHWPEDLPSGIARKIADYQARRSALKKELYDVVFKADRTWFSIVRRLQFHLTLGPQAAALDQLEELAEDIRRELVQSPAVVPDARRRSIPPAITQRIGAVLESQRALGRESAETIEAIRRRETSLEISYAFEPTGLPFEVRPRARFLPGKNAAAIHRSTTVKIEIAAIAASHRDMLAALAREDAAIRTALAQALRLEEPREIEAALIAATREAFEQESDGPFRAYHNAVFEPGLSPEQRRLLFDSAIEQLGLPLPAGEYQPR